MATYLPITEHVRIEKGTQTDNSLPAPAPNGTFAGSNSTNERNSNSSSANGETDGDVEKQKPRYYDPETMLVHWTDSDDPVGQ